MTSSVSRVRRKWATFELARELYSGSLRSSSRFDHVRRLRASCSFFADARPLSRTAATSATSMTHVVSRTVLSISSAEQEWSPASAGNAAKSMQPGFFP